MSASSAWPSDSCCAPSPSRPDSIGPYLPSRAGQAFMSIAGDPGLLSPAAGAAVFTGWSVALLAVAGTGLRRRDAG
ncbi:hypothetical protein GCM10010168_49800 [Actinoplanes ianthinogenes]|uniref:Uncharacterized protein n=1 Tax=Actinoplanes ianthinogenes TaxID=122358 RepID=A0ABM7M301_9ACTN|nr:hypothetical protein Aiant_66890 [Actinoplanes ianthinogenes]GGR25789.1 hypothetical protein GCM10010168_49800 [Actinoplanes ianthinogenes]